MKDENQKSEIESLESKLTAYAFGELPESERAEIESLLEKDETLRAEVEEMRATADLLADELKTEVTPELTDEEKRRIREAVGAAPKFPEIARPTVFQRIARYGAFGAVAACLAVAAVVAFNANLKDDIEPLVAVNEVSEEEIKQKSEERIKQLRSQIAKADEDVDVDDARVRLLDMAEHLKISELAGGKPSWMGSDEEVAFVEFMEIAEGANMKVEPLNAKKVKAEMLSSSLAGSFMKNDPIADGVSYHEHIFDPFFQQVVSDGLHAVDEFKDSGGQFQFTLSIRYFGEVGENTTGSATGSGDAILSRGKAMESGIAPATAITLAKQGHAGSKVFDRTSRSPEGENRGAQIVAGRALQEVEEELQAAYAEVKELGETDTLLAKLVSIRDEVELAKKGGERERAEKLTQELKKLTDSIDLEEANERLELMFAKIEKAQEIQERKKQLEALLRRQPSLDPSNEDYGQLKDNPWISTWQENFSTFSIDVDTASYSNVRRFIANRSQLPPRDAVRIEEMINYFDYDYPQPEGEHPFGVTTEVAGCPWAPDHRLVRIGLKGKEMHVGERPPMNLVFLIDVSGSMSDQNKLPLLKTSMKKLVDQLSPRDRIAMVVYAGSAGVVLDATSGDRKDEIKGALERLQSGGSTAGGAGIQRAYEVAKQNFIDGGVNRVILATDGDFNVGTTDTNTLVEMVAARAKSDDVFLTILGFGEGNLKESRMEQIANKGNGNYYYIDNEKEGRRVLVEKLSGTLVTIAKDVKIQIDFNPGKVAYYRLIGYANRLLDKKDFADDTKDAGEIGAGHTVTALYEVVPAGVELKKPGGTDPKSRYFAASDDDEDEIRAAPAPKELVESPEMLTVKLRYKQPEGTKSTLLEVPLVDEGSEWATSSGDFRFAAAVAGYGMMLRESPHRGNLSYDQVLELAIEGSHDGRPDPNGLREEFIEMVKTTKRMTAN
ncbi:MAG: von Willebrand factor type A domain-containing protein [Verrucomicrobiota bacterium]